MITYAVRFSITHRHGRAQVTPVSPIASTKREDRRVCSIPDHTAQGIGCDRLPQQSAGGGGSGQKKMKDGAGTGLGTDRLGACRYCFASAADAHFCADTLS